MGVVESHQALAILAMQCEGVAQPVRPRRRNGTHFTMNLTQCFPTVSTTITSPFQIE
jgi:hypothetical protein